MPDIFVHHSLNLLFLAGFGLAAFGSGRFLLSKVPFDSFSESFVFSAGLGFGVLSGSVFLVCTLGVLYPQVVYGLVGVWGVSALLGLRKAGGGRSGPTPPLPG